MPKKAISDWNCLRDNPGCLLHMEFGACCYTSIRSGKCHRPDNTIPSGVSGILALLPRRKCVVERGETMVLPSPVVLTPEQLHRMAQEEFAEFNPNLVDSPAQAAEHGFVWKRGPLGS